ncbi:MAG: ACP S-malonyltransferase [Gemmataceae bacterium]
MPKIAFLFPGQGAQAVGMGRQLCETRPAARELFDRAQSILGYDLAEVCANGPAERLNATDVSQPAIFVTSLAAMESLRTSDPGVVESCTAAAGLSLGEYTALVFAEAMTFEDGLRLVQKRGEAMQAASEANPGAMISVIGLDQAKAQELCQAAQEHGTIKLANLLCPGNIVLSGSKPACDAVEKIAETMGARTVRLAVAGAFHTDLMKPADDILALALSKVEIGPPRIPVWSNVDAQPHTDPSEIRGLLIRQVLQPVLWEQTMRNLLASGWERFYEIGPGRVLAGLLKRVQRKVDCQNVSG